MSKANSSWSHAPLSPPFDSRDEQYWMHFDSSINAISFGFVATAILISMFLVMAIFERFLRPRSFSDGRLSDDLEVPPLRSFNSKLSPSAPSMSVYAKGVSVLMPGQAIPTFIAHPAPIPCDREHVFWPHHQQNPFSNIIQTSGPFHSVARRNM